MSSDTVKFTRLAQEYRDRCKQEDPNAPDYEQFTRALDALSDQTSEAARRVLSRAPQSWTDIIARACIVAHYHGHDLVALGEADSEVGLDRWAAESLAIAILQSNRLREEPALPPLTPTELNARVRTAIARVSAAAAQYNALVDVRAPDFEHANARAAAAFCRRLDELKAIAAEMPDPPASFDDVLVRAEIAYFHADERRDSERPGQLFVDSGDVYDDAAAMVINAVLQMGGRCNG